MASVTERFLRYVSIDTQSMEDQERYPSTAKQLDLARLLVQELKELGADNVRQDQYGYVMAELPATTDKKIPVLGFLAHMDTAPACSGAGVRPQIIRNYDGGTILLHPDKKITMSPEEFPELAGYKGQDLITTDGTTLLGADDKAGIAEIMTSVEFLLQHPELPHGKICIAFTPDEEIGRGADFFDVENFAAEVAYTVDGGPLGELEYETFNAAGAKIMIHGVSIHPGAAKRRMKNALLVGMELQQMLPVFENPVCTEGYEGFYHLDHMCGGVEQVQMKYIIRDHDQEKFRQKKELMEEAVEYLNRKYGEGTIALDMQDSYYNMKEKIEPYFYLITVAENAMKELGITPVITPVRGGTDGARLSYEGLPCPNLCTGGHNFHGRFEYISIQSMERVAELLVKITGKFVLL